MIVDAHHHLWRIDQGYSWLNATEVEPIRHTFSPAELRAELTAHGVDRTVLVEGGRCDGDEARLLFGYLAETPEIAGVVAWADPCSPDLDETLLGYRALPGGERLVGIREQIQGVDDPGYLDRDDLRRGLSTIGAQGLAFDLVIRADQIAAAARLAGELPAVRFVLDHLGKPAIRTGRFRSWAADLALLAACPNVTAKLSGLVTEASWDSWTVDDLRPYVEEALRLFGADRLMFGSDWPVCTLAPASRNDAGPERGDASRAAAGNAEHENAERGNASASAYGKWFAALEVILPADAREAVLGGTAAQTYHLSLD
ncbi:amidohydrolase family protein [Actinoplanes sp. KI2]|uniref:amidohydrolase family protein n=1 Tax=Actinoplanes sp. KI2 TaxID=2983315 RepID=UPI0021D5FB16|nr:amidohydrolase family protein [Actinoplanes sp. KI2]MCU7726210.1 amidohydrolase family protein [Actinoplanes sp. KI2]